MYVLDNNGVIDSRIVAMTDILVNLGERSYVVTIGSGILSKTGELVAAVSRPPAVLVVSDVVVARLYASEFLASLERSGVRGALMTIPSGERAKNLNTVRRIYSALVQHKMDRTCAIAALGGGVVGDLAGFAAATYMRGVDFYQLPTTLLAQVDASVGGKTGVDLPEGKNLVGAFHQPRRVIIDILTLKTLPARELRAGLAEVVKHGIICDKAFFEFVRDNASELIGRRDVVLHEAVKRSVEIKRDVVQQDERESGLRAILNYGHTVAHAIEAVTGYRRYRHGEAVAIGMVVEAHIAEKIGVAKESVFGPVSEAVHKLRLPARIDASYSPDALLGAIELDKKVKAGQIRMALPVRIGECGVFTVDKGAILGAIEDLREDLA